MKNTGCVLGIACGFPNRVQSRFGLNQFRNIVRHKTYLMLPICKYKSIISYKRTENNLR
ncbi:hypothetical protein HanRHA438_Chr06g0263221 [Helianthus annuus]|nr:hypothetical protein HanRHA438_Chr06g0263221 [Helianthus annuus]